MTAGSGTRTAATEVAARGLGSLARGMTIGVRNRSRFKGTVLWAFVVAFPLAIVAMTVPEEIGRWILPAGVFAGAVGVWLGMIWPQKPVVESKPLQLVHRETISELNEWLPPFSLLSASSRLPLRKNWLEGVVLRTAFFLVTRISPRPSTGGFDESAFSRIWVACESVVANIYSSWVLGHGEPGTDLDINYCAREASMLRHWEGDSRLRLVKVLLRDQFDDFHGVPRHLNRLLTAWSPRLALAGGVHWLEESIRESDFYFYQHRLFADLLSGFKLVVEPREIHIMASRPRHREDVAATKEADILRALLYMARKKDSTGLAIVFSHNEAFSGQSRDAVMDASKFVALIHVISMEERAASPKTFPKPEEFEGAPSVEVELNTRVPVRNRMRFEVLDGARLVGFGQVQRPAG